jgi:hypothetical protein
MDLANMRQSDRSPASGVANLIYLNAARLESLLMDLANKG